MSSSHARWPTLVATALLALGVAGCPSGGGGAGATEAAWPTGSKIKPESLPSTVTWTGVYFISTAGARGMMHVFVGADDKLHGCWLAEDKHAKATFTGKVKENVAMFDWTEKRVGFAGAPQRVSAYLVLTPDAEGRHKVKGEYGADLSSDSGSKWEGIRQKNQEPKEDGCKLEEGDTIPTEAKPLD